MKKLFTLLLVLTGMVTTASATDVYLKGTINNWISSNDYKFNNEGKLSLHLTENQSFTFKLWADTGGDGTWYGNGGSMSWKNSNNWEFTNGGDDTSFTAVSEGDYIFTWDGSKLTVTYPAIGTIYFNNTLGWAQPYFYILDDNKWDDSYPEGVILSDFFNGIAMEQIGSSDIWKADYPISYSYVAFLKDNQNGYAHIHNTKAVWRTDFNSSTPVFVPDTTKSTSKNSTDYYSNGGWYSYSAPASNYVRTVNTDTYGTICLPYAASLTGATVYEITGKIMESENIAGIYISPYEGTLQAGKPYIFKATGTEISATLSGNYTSATINNGLVGNLGASIKAPENSFVIGSDNLIHKVISGDDGVNVGQYKAYIDMDEVLTITPAPGLEFIPFFDSELSGINTVQASESKVNGYFNLNGQRVAQPTKGLYIMNGKKVVLK